VHLPIPDIPLRFKCFEQFNKGLHFGDGNLCKGDIHSGAGSSIVYIVFYGTGMAKGKYVSR
jgi:hypothetical protein